MFSPSHASINHGYNILLSSMEEGRNNKYREPYKDVDQKPPDQFPIDFALVCKGTFHKKTK
jgi:hypothetical protein